MLEKLVELAGVYHVRIRSYCLMVNHFHGYLQTLGGNLGRFMQAFLTSFAIRYNLRYKVRGHVFQGRYKAFLVEEAREFRALAALSICKKDYGKLAVLARGK